MSQHDFDIANQGFPATRADLNNALQALASASSGATAPSTTYANQLWYDTANNILKFRNEDNDAWIDLLYLDQTNDAVARLDVDNIRIDGNTISSTDTNGDITLDPDGTGNLIVASGNVGIGTSSPGSPLDVSGNVNLSNGAWLSWGGNLANAINGDDTTDVIKINTSGVERMRIDSGNVGIGTSSPSYKMALEDSSNFAIHLLKTGSNDGWVRNIGTMDIAAASGGGGGQVITFSTGANYAGLTERMRIDGVGNVMVGTTSAISNYGEKIAANVASGTTTPISTKTYATTGFYAIEFHNPNGRVGNILTNGSATAFNTSSDYRLKENVTDMTGAIDRVKALAPKRFNFIADPDRTVDGFIAHEAQAVVPEAISGTHNEVEVWTQAEIDEGIAPENTSAGDNKLDEDGNTIPVMQGIDQSKLVPLLTGALREAITKIETLETQVADLTTRVAALEA